MKTEAKSKKNPYFLDDIIVEHDSYNKNNYNLRFKKFKIPQKKKKLKGILQAC